ncbi:MAG: hypothetical protein Q9164_002369 [Protoblastenia rupestris]
MEADNLASASAIDGLPFRGLPAEVRELIWQQYFKGNVKPQPAQRKELVEKNGKWPHGLRDVPVEELVRREERRDAYRLPDIILRIIRKAQSTRGPDLTQDLSRRQSSPLALLSVSKTVHEEAASVFYGRNVFELPHGPVEHSIAYLHRLQPHHLSMIQDIQITFSELDLTPDVLRQTEQRIKFGNIGQGLGDGLSTWRLNFPRLFPHATLESLPARFLARACSRHLWYIWARKLVLVRRYDNLKHLRLKSNISELVLDGTIAIRSGIQTNRFNELEYGKCSTEVQIFMTAVRSFMYQWVWLIVTVLGWKGLKSRLSKKTESR